MQPKKIRKTLALFTFATHPWQCITAIQNKPQKTLVLGTSADPSLALGTSAEPPSVLLYTYVENETAKLGIRHFR